MAGEDFGGFDFSGSGGDYGTGLGQDISTYIPPSMSFSPGTAVSTGPYGETGGSGFNLDTLSGYAKEALPFLKLGAQGLGAYTGIQGIIGAKEQAGYLRDAQKRAQQGAAPGIEAAGQLIPSGTSAALGGPLPANLEATAANWTNAAKARLRQFFAHSGITDSTMIAQAEAQIDAQAQELRAKLAAGLLQSGQGMLGAGTQATQLEGNLALREGDTINAAIQDANKALFSMLGMTG